MVKEKTVCFNCAGKSLGDYIREHGTEDKCSYCSTIGNNVAIPILDLKECILNAWGMFYSDEGDIYYGEENEILTSWDLIFYSPFTELDDAKETFL